MSEQQNPKRAKQRLGLKLPIRVRCRETVDLEWSEVTRLIDVTPYGAGFTLKRPIEKGRLLHMTIPMPQQLRAFDHAEDQYKVWAVVRYVRDLTDDSKQPLFEVGVAFIGKHPPRSYGTHPAMRYEVGPIQPGQQLAAAKEMETVGFGANDKRTATRHNIPVDMLIEILNEKGEVESSEHTVTENISRKGAVLYTTLNLPVGRILRLSSQQYKISAYAAVRGSSIGSIGMPRIHVEFIGREWPL